MRDLLRTRKQLVREQASHVQRIQKTLEEANLKLASVLTDIMGQSGRAVLDALVKGERDPAGLQTLVSPRVKAAPEAIRAALTGRIGDHHRFLLGVPAPVRRAGASHRGDRRAGGARPRPFREAVELLVTIRASVTSPRGHPLRDRPRHERFPTAGHLILGGLCPRNDESAGKRRSTRLRKGAPWIKTALVRQLGGLRKKTSYFRRSSSVYAAGVVPRRRSAPWRPRC